MDDKKIKEITKPFSKDEIKKAPKGKFGQYVPHHLVTKRLNKVAYGEWSHTLKEVVRNFESTELDFVQDETINFFKNQCIKNAIIKSVDI